MNEHLHYIETLANNALKSIDCTEPPVPVDKIAEKLELRVIPFKFPDSISGVLRKGKKAIGVNEAHHAIRQRFTIAHEIGHFVLNHGNDEDMVDGSFNGGGSNGIEREANAFASFLLMPREWVLDRHKKIGLDPKKLAKEFNVSEQAMTIKLLELDLIK
jgi:Zn-dependent peptidase ImmA (M78 family)